MQTIAAPLQFFEDGFRALTGNPPLGWQTRLFLDHFQCGTPPKSVDLPTGYHLFYPSRRQSSAAFALVVDALRYRA